MKKSQGFLIAVAGLFAISSLPFGTKFVKANAETIAQQIAGLVDSFESEGRKYTKKSSICFNATAMGELSKYFHARQTGLNRTTYYSENDETLLMALPNGQLDKTYGGYKSNRTGTKMTRFHIKDGTTLDNMFDPDNHITDFEYGDGFLRDNYVTLSKFTDSSYFDESWIYTEEYDQYTHDVDNNNRDDDKYYNDFLAFCAPMLTAEYSKEYIHVRSVGIRAKLDSRCNKYLQMRIYVDDADAGKLNGLSGVTTMAEARVYKGIKGVGDEDLRTGYFVKGTIGGEDYFNAMTLDPNDHNQYVLKGLSLSKDDLVTVYSNEDREGIWYNGVDHHWSNPVVIDGLYHTDYKVQMTSSSYDIYFKLDTQRFYVTAKKDTMFFKPNGETWNKDGAWFAIEYLDDSGNHVSWERLKDPDDNGYYTHHVPTGASKMIYYRMASGKSTLDASSAWNKSGVCNLANTDVNNAFFQWSDCGYDNWTFETYNVGSWTNM